jgi:hypothetical protein
MKSYPKPNWNQAQKARYDQLTAEAQEIVDSEVRRDTQLIPPPCEHGRVNQLWEADQKVYRAQEQELKRVRATLKELCEVKIIKDVQGDTPWYRERKGPAWKAAFACFPEYLTEDKPSAKD